MLKEEYMRLAKSIESVSHEQCKGVIEVALDRLRQDIGAMIADLWVRSAGHEGIDFLHPYVTRNDNLRPTPMPIALTPVATGLLIWIAEHREPVWVDDFDEHMLSSKCVTNRCDGARIEGRYVNWYHRTRGFAAVPVLYRGQLLGILTVETDQPGLIGNHHTDLMRALAEPTGIMIRKAESFEERRNQINEAVS